MSNFSFDEKVIHINLEENTDVDVISTLAKSLTEQGYVADSFLEAIIEREKVFPTGLPTGEIGVAIPHTDSEHVHKPMVAMISKAT